MSKTIFSRCVYFLQEIEIKITVSGLSEFSIKNNLLQDIKIEN